MGRFCHHVRWMASRFIPTMRVSLEAAPLGSYMTMVLTVLEAHVEPTREAAMQTAYRDAVQDSFPPGLVRSTLLRATDDRTVWRIETLWESREALEAMRGTGTPRGVQIFRTAGAEPTLSVLEVVAALSPPKGERPGT